MWKALVPSASSSLCSKLLQTPALLAIYAYRTAVWAINAADNTASDDLLAWLNISTTPAGVPGGVTASDGTFDTKVAVSWTGVAGALSYSVWRSNTANSADAAQIGSSVTTSFDDTGIVVGTTYTYFIKSVSNTGTSAFSTGDTGYAQVGSGAGEQSFSTGTNTFTVPAGVILITIAEWGPGGVGGARGVPAMSPPGTYVAGGGGGGGEAASGTLTVSAGHVYTVTIDSAGAAFKDGATVIMSCVGGSPGQSGVYLGVGGAGGTGGTTHVSVTPIARDQGSVGADGAGGVGGAGGATTPTEAGAGTGGPGSDADPATPTTASPGKIKITWT